MADNTDTGQRITLPHAGPSEESDSLFDRVVGATLTVLTGSEAGRFFYLEDVESLLGRGDEADITFVEETISREHARLTLDERGYKLTDLDSRNGTFVNAQRISGEQLLPPHCRLRLGGRIVLQFTAVDDLGARAVEKLERALLVDPLTGTGNRLHLKQRLDAELSFARRHETDFGMLLLDLDRFKLVNDGHGHLVGDRVLVEVGRTLRDLLRSEDSVFRYGGEEFCILVRGLSDDNMMIMAERVRLAVERLEIRAGRDERVQITTSLGVASLGEGESRSETDIILRADRALYRAKENGRNRAELYSPSEDDALPRGAGVGRAASRETGDFKMIAMDQTSEHPTLDEPLPED